MEKKIVATFVRGDFVLLNSIYCSVVTVFPEVCMSEYMTTGAPLTLFRANF
jgi:hypothetical protein